MLGASYLQSQQQEQHFGHHPQLWLKTAGQTILGTVNDEWDTKQASLSLSKRIPGCLFKPWFPAKKKGYNFMQCSTPMPFKKTKQQHIVELPFLRFLRFH
jgi:hypothetical protein